MATCTDLACRKLKKGVPQKWPISMQNDSYPFFHFSARIANMTTQSSSLDIRPFHTALHHVSSWNAQILDHVQRCVGHYVDYFGASTLIVSFLLLPLRRPCRNERALKLGVPLFFSLINLDLLGNTVSHVHVHECGINFHKMYWGVREGCGLLENRRKQHSSTVSPAYFRKLYKSRPDYCNSCIIPEIVQIKTRYRNSRLENSTVFQTGITVQGLDLYNFRNYAGITITWCEFGRNVSVIF